MRILTIKQPWAWLIAGGFKHVENRSANIAGDYRGPVAIHAGRRMDLRARGHPEVDRVAREQWNAGAQELFVGMPKMFGHILAVADLYAVHQHDGSRGFVCCPNAPDRYTRWAEPNKWHLCFASPRTLADPIPYRGALGLRSLDMDTISLIEEQLK